MTTIETLVPEQLWQAIGPLLPAPVPGLRDRPLGVVVPLVLVTADDMPGLEGRDLVDRVPPWPEASDNHTFPRYR
jgi:hypothetical protein